MERDLTSTRRSGGRAGREHEVRGGGGLRLHAREWGNPDGPAILFIHGWSQSELCWARQVARRARRATSASSRSTTAGHGMSEKPLERRALQRRAALGGRPRGGHRADRPRASGAGGVVLRRFHRDRLRPRLRRGGDRRQSTSSAPPCMHAAASTTSARASSRTPGTPARPTCRRTSPPSGASCGPARRSRSTTTTGARRWAGTWSCRPRCGRAVRARDRRGRRARAPDGAGARDATDARTRSSCPRWRSTCSSVCGTARASWYDGVGHLPFVEDPAGSTASSPSSPGREQGGGDHAPGVRVRAVARRDARATLRR